MSRILLGIALRLALCVACSWLVWRSFGLVGIALARPLLDLASELKHQTRAAVWRPVEGRYFAFRGIPVQVLEDEDHRRWVLAADVRRIVGFTASDGTLALTYPDGWRMMSTPARPHVSDDALLVHLGKEKSPEALRLRHWVEREIAIPARRRRESMGMPPAVRHTERGR